MTATSTSVSERRVAIIIPSLLPFGGVERVVLTHASMFMLRGVKVDLVVINEPQELAGIVPTGCRVFNLDAPRLRNALLPLVRYLCQERPAAVHANMWPLTSIVALAHKIAISNSRLILTDHNPLTIQYAPRGRFHRMLLRSSVSVTYRWADVRTAVSAGVAEDLSKLSGLGRDKFSVIHNPITFPLNISQDTDAEEAWGGWSGKRIITAGRLKRQKNYPMLLRAFKAMLMKVDARLMILGVGELFDEISSYVAFLGLSNHVLMVGQVDNPASYFSTADLFVLSSDYEGFGNVIVEALACGLPVVSTNCPYGPSEILANGSYGRLVAVGDESSFSTAMATALNESCNEKSQKRRAADFSPEIAVERYLTLLFPSTSLADSNVKSAQ